MSLLLPREGERIVLINVKGKGNIQRRGGENIGEFVDERLSS